MLLMDNRQYMLHHILILHKYLLSMPFSFQNFQLERLLNKYIIHNQKSDYLQYTSNHLDKRMVLHLSLIHILIAVAKQLHLVSFKAQNFSQLLSHLSIEFDFFIKLCGIFLFLLIGMLFLQMILVVISSFISSIEAASSIQAPFYMILIAVYYLTLSLNNPEQMANGLGYYLSFLPFFSMLMMPCRLLLTTVTIPEFLLALGFALSALAAVLHYGGAIYQKGVLEYSNKGLLQIIRSMCSKTS